MDWVTMGEGLKAAALKELHAAEVTLNPMLGLIESLRLSLLDYVWSLSRHVSRSLF